MLRLLLSVAVITMCFGWPAVSRAADTFKPDQPLHGALSLNLLRSLFNQALDQLEDHVDLSSQLGQPETPTDRQRSLRFRYYPEGRSKSDRHLSAEGWFSSAPESGEFDWHFRFKWLEDRAKGHLHIESPL